jgi:hypothetical protein
MFIVLVLLFVIFTPKIFFSLPIKGSKYTIAFVHAILFALTWVLIHTFVWRMVPHCRRRRLLVEGATDNSNKSPTTESNKAVKTDAPAKTAQTTGGTPAKTAPKTGAQTKDVPTTGAQRKNVPTTGAQRKDIPTTGTSMKAAATSTGSSMKAAATSTGTSMKADATSTGSSMKAAATSTGTSMKAAATSTGTSMKADATQQTNANIKYPHLRNEIIFDANQIKIWKDQLISDQDEYNRLLKRSPPNPFRF